MRYIHTVCGGEKDILPYVTTWMNLEDIIPSETSQSQKDKYVHGVSKIVKLLEAESRIVVARGWG